MELFIKTDAVFCTRHPTSPTKVFTFVPLHLAHTGWVPASQDLSVTHPCTSHTVGSQQCFSAWLLFPGKAVAKRCPPRTKGCLRHSGVPTAAWLIPGWSFWFLAPLFHPLPLRSGHSLSFRGSLQKTFLHAQHCGLFGFSAPFRMSLSCLGILVS